MWMHVEEKVEAVEITMRMSMRYVISQPQGGSICGDYSFDIRGICLFYQ